MTKDTGEQFYAVACCEYTLPRSDATSCLYGKHGIEIRIWSLSQDNSQSWVRISHGSNKFVIDSNHNNTEVPADLPEEQSSQLKVEDFCSLIEGKSKTTKKRTCPFTEHHSDE